MKRQVWTGGIAAVALACGVSLAAQTPAATQSGTPSTVTVTGCLQRGNSMSGTTGTTGSATSGTSAASASASASDHFMLTNAKMGSGSSSTTGAAGSATTGTTGSGTSATGAAGSSTSGASYVLEGSTSDLSSHVGHEIEVRGKIDSSSTGSSYGSGASTGSAAAGATTGSASATSAQKLQVESVRMIASTCSAR
jgi:hypothetical protein